MADRNIFEEPKQVFSDEAGSIFRHLISQIMADELAGGRQCSD